MQANTVSIETSCRHDNTTILRPTWYVTGAIVTFFLVNQYQGGLRCPDHLLRPDAATRPHFLQTNPMPSCSRNKQSFQKSLPASLTRHIRLLQVD
jgi:hypothetical protein